MKNGIKLIGGLLVFVSINACQETEHLPTIEKGAMVYFSQGADDTGLINFLDLDATRLNFTIDLTDAQGRNLEFDPVASVDVMVTYTDASIGTSYEALLENTAVWPKTYDLSLPDVVALFPAGVVSIGGLELGDSFFITTNFTMEDGRKLSGWSPSLLDNSPASIYRVFVNYPVACPSALAGTYLAQCLDCPNGELASQTVTVTEVSPGTYTLSDVTMDVFGNTPVAYNFSDVCGTLTMAPASQDFGTAVVVEAQEGTQVTLETGVITLSLGYVAPACCGLPGLTLTYTLTPQ